MRHERNGDREARHGIRTWTTIGSTSVNEESVILDTERLLLRKPTLSDVDPLVELWSDPEVTRHLGGPRNEEALRESFEQAALSPFAEDYDLWPVVEKQSGKVVGQAGLLDKQVEGHTEIELVYVIAPPHWGKGYATEIASALLRHAFEVLQLDRVIALVEPTNKPSERVAIKIGMTFKNTVARPGGQQRKLYVIDVPEPPESE